ncbi:MAG TPA: type II toxin-antitoxin system RelE/ParE family toxin [Lachnospiraceae bacterium]|nr:type II toxin-antitoxin system RelE/ParE family toxin [Lachnospiraceae bacterium]
MTFARNSKYKVVITRNAKLQLTQILQYLHQNLRSEQAARNVRDDINETRLRLADMADNLKLCDYPELRALGYRTIHLRRHRYFMLYKIINGVVRVDGIYHDLQDYENIFSNSL